MSAIMRQSRHVPSIKNDPYAQVASPVTMVNNVPSPPPVIYINPTLVKV